MGGLGLPVEGRGQNAGSGAEGVTHDGDLLRLRPSHGGARCTEGPMRNNDVVQPVGLPEIPAGAVTAMEESIPELTAQGKKTHRTPRKYSRRTESTA